MVHQTSNRSMQAIMNNLKFIILDYFAAKKSGMCGLTQRFLRLIHKQSLYLESNVLHSRA